MKVNHSAKIRLSSTVTLGQLISEAVAGGIPETAKIDTYHYKGDPRDPREFDYTELIFKWETN